MSAVLQRQILEQREKDAALQRERGNAWMRYASYAEDWLLELASVVEKRILASRGLLPQSAIEHLKSVPFPRYPEYEKDQRVLRGLLPESSTETTNASKNRRIV